MATDRMATSGDLRLDRLAAARLMAVLIVISLFTAISVTFLSIWTMAGLIVLTTLLILKRSPLCVIFILAACLGERIYWAWSYRVWQMSLSPGDVVLATSMLVFMAASLRYLSLDPKGFRWLGEPADRESQGSGTETLRPFSLAWIRLPAALALAWAILAVFSQPLFWPNQLAFNPAVLRWIVVTWAMAVLIVVPVAVVSLVRWRTLSPAQAQLYARHTLAKEVGREQKHLERAIARRRNRTVQKRLIDNVDDDS